VQEEEGRQSKLAATRKPFPVDALEAARADDEEGGDEEEQITHAQVELAFSKLVDVSARLARHLESVRSVVRFAAAFEHPQHAAAEDSDSDTEL
jgi:hypothetical protein